MALAAVLAVQYSDFDICCTGRTASCPTEQRPSQQCAAAGAAGAAVASAAIMSHLCDSLRADPLVQVVDYLFVHAGFEQ